MPPDRARHQQAVALSRGDVDRRRHGAHLLRVRAACRRVGRCCLWRGSGLSPCPHSSAALALPLPSWHSWRPVPVRAGLLFRLGRPHARLSLWGRQRLEVEMASRRRHADLACLHPRPAAAHACQAWSGECVGRQEGANFDGARAPPRRPMRWTATYSRSGTVERGKRNGGMLLGEVLLGPSLATRLVILVVRTDAAPRGLSKL